MRLQRDKKKWPLVEFSGGPTVVSNTFLRPTDLSTLVGMEH